MSFFIFYPKTMVHIWEISYQLYSFQNNGETTGRSWCHFLFSALKQWCTFEKFLTSSTLSSIMGRSLESWYKKKFHPKTIVHLWEICYQIYPFQNKGETTGVMMSYFVSTLNQWCKFERFLISYTRSRIKGRQLGSHDVIFYFPP